MNFFGKTWYWFLDLVSKKKINDFNGLENYPDLKEAIVPTIKRLPIGSINTKVIINEGEVVERVYETPKGKIISLLENEIAKNVS